ncbi:MAG: FHA domain-containing protein [Prochloraceae cyanobacterium]
MNSLNKDLNHVLILKYRSKERIIVLDRERYSLGRNPGNDIIIKDKQVSRYHATIIKRTKNNAQDYFWIYDGNLKDKKSSNGLVVNRRFCQSHCLRRGDIILLGNNVKIQYYQFASQTLDLLKSIENQNQSKDLLLKLNDRELNGVDINRLTDVVVPTV